MVWKSYRTPITYWFRPEQLGQSVRAQRFLRTVDGYHFAELTAPAELVVAYGDVQERTWVKHVFEGPMAETRPKPGTELLFRGHCREFVYHVVVGDGMTFIEGEPPFWENVPAGRPDSLRSRPRLSRAGWLTRASVVGAARLLSDL